MKGKEIEDLNKVIEGELTAGIREVHFLSLSLALLSFGDQNIRHYLHHFALYVRMISARSRSSQRRASRVSPAYSMTLQHFSNH